jgi:hypothetical protein
MAGRGTNSTHEIERICEKQWASLTTFIQHKKVYLMVHDGVQRKQRGNRGIDVPHLESQQINI